MPSLNSRVFTEMLVTVTVLSILGIGTALIGATLYVSAGCFLVFGDTLFSLVGVSCPIF